MSKNNGGVAFPSRLENHSDEEVIGFHGEPLRPKRFSSYPGITIRDYFAAKALNGMLAYPGCDQRGSHHNNNTPEGVASMAYEYADAMLKERVK